MATIRTPPKIVAGAESPDGLSLTASQSPIWIPLTMPWTPADAPHHTEFANQVLATTGDEGRAIRVANHALHKDRAARTNKPPRLI